MKVDYIIVGCGLAGISFCEQLRKHNKTFVVFDDNSQVSSTVAGGLYNPIVLKRFTPVWKNKEQLELALPVYKDIEKELGVKLDHKLSVLRLFNSIEEQNNWFAASDKVRLSRWLSDKIIPNNNQYIDAQFGFGEVLETGRVDTSLLTLAYKKHLKGKGIYFANTFNYDKVLVSDGSISYKKINAKNIIFAEGFGLKKNPYFKDLPLNGTKGELLIIKAQDLKINFVLKSGVFLIPLEDDKYIVGATYEWKDKTNNVTQEAKEELLKKLKSFLKCDFSIVGQVAGIRPTVIDRRPLVGVHKENTNVFVLNGLGTRGVMIAPYIARKLFNFIENNIPLEKEIDINRFN